MDINIVAILIASFAAFVFGALWYSPTLFMSQWCQEAGIAPDEKLQNPAKVYGLTFLMTLISAFGISLIIGKNAGIFHGLLIGTIIGLLIVMTSMGINYQFDGRTLKHWLIDGGFQVFRFTIMGAIIGIF